MLDQWHTLNSPSPGDRTLWLVVLWVLVLFWGLGMGNSVQGLLDGFCGDERDPQMMLGIERGSVSCKTQAFTPKPSLQLGILLAHRGGFSHSEHTVCGDFRVACRQSASTD